MHSPDVKNKTALTACRLLLAAIFGWSGLVKLSPSEQIVLTLTSVFPLPHPVASAIATTLPFIELGAAICLLWPRASFWGAAIISLLCTAFIIFIGTALAQGIIVDCACFGESTPSAQKMQIALVRDILLLATALFVAIRTRPGTRRTSQKTPTSDVTP